MHNQQQHSNAQSIAMMHAISSEVSSHFLIMKKILLANNLIIILNKNQCRHATAFHLRLDIFFLKISLNRPAFH